MAPADDILRNYVRNIHREGPLDDFKFLRCGIQRTLGQGASGRDFIQTHRQVFKENLARSSFFDSLHSPRRRQMLTAVNTGLVLRSTGGLEDLPGRFPELRNRPLFGMDGHHVDHATHSPAGAEGDYVSANSLYVLCLHRGLLFNLGAVQGDGVRRHEMPVFRQRIVEWLRRPGPKRRGPSRSSQGIRDLWTRPFGRAWRWRIGKVFDTGRNKLEETKGWAAGEFAQDIRAHFFALTHNRKGSYGQYFKCINLTPLP